MAVSELCDRRDRNRFMSVALSQCRTPHTAITMVNWIFCWIEIIWFDSISCCEWNSIINISINIFCSTRTPIRTEQNEHHAKTQKLRRPNEWNNHTSTTSDLNNNIIHKWQMFFALVRKCIPRSSIAILHKRIATYRFVNYPCALANRRTILNKISVWLKSFRTKGGRK